jgi:hypothetical protein
MVHIVPVSVRYSSKGLWRLAYARCITLNSRPIKMPKPIIGILATALAIVLMLTSKHVPTFNLNLEIEHVKLNVTAHSRR